MDLERHIIRIMSNIINDQGCDYGFYATNKELLSAGINCNKPETHLVNFKDVVISLCKDSYQNKNPNLNFKLSNLIDD